MKNRSEQPRFIFLFAPKNSGTTIISQYIAQQVNGFLPPFGNNEGQSAPAVREMMRRGRWKPDVDYDWTFIRREWERLLDASGKTVFVEASPPNLMRFEAIDAVFGRDARYLFSISSPYSQIASCLYNYREPPATPALIRRLASLWLDRARRIDRLRALVPDAPFVGYADFCADPRRVNRALCAPEAPIAPLPGKRTSGRSEIVDMSAVNIAFLRPEEHDAATKALMTEAPLLTRLGLSVEVGCDLVERAREQPDLAREGALRRRRWDAGETKAAAKRRAKAAARIAAAPETAV